MSSSCLVGKLLYNVLLLFGVSQPRKTSAWTLQ